MAIIVGLSDSQKILNSASLSVSDVGMQTLTETYTVTRVGLDYFNPRVNDPHPVFPTLACASSDLSPSPGELRILVVRWVGLIEAGSEKYVGADPAIVPAQPQVIETFPPPLVATLDAGRRRTRLQDGGPIEGSTVSTSNRLITLSNAARSDFGLARFNTKTVLENPPVSSSGDWLEFPYVVNVSFVIFGDREAQEDILRNYAPGFTLMPQEIRGVNLPGYPEPYIFRKSARKDYGAVDPAVGAELVNAIQVYYGVRLRTISFEKQGFFNVVYLSFGDLFEVATYPLTVQVVS